MSEFTGEFLRSDNLGKPSRIHGSIVKKIEFGVEGPKFLSQARLERNHRGRAIGLVFTEILDPKTVGNVNRFAHRVLEKHSWLKNHNLPVVPTLRYDPKKHQFMQTDMSRGGKFRIIDKHLPIGKSGITINNLEEVKMRIMEIAKLAFDRGNGVLLSIDSYAVIVDKGGNGTAFLLDLGLNSWLLSKEKPAFISGVTTVQHAYVAANQFINIAL
jgi:hypothetical protein